MPLVHVCPSEWPSAHPATVPGLWLRAERPLEFSRRSRGTSLGGFWAAVLTSLGELRRRRRRRRRGERRQNASKPVEEFIKVCSQCPLGEPLAKRGKPCSRKAVWGHDFAGCLGGPLGASQGVPSGPVGPSWFLWRASQDVLGVSGWPPRAAWGLRPIPPPCLGCGSEAS